MRLTKSILVLAIGAITCLSGCRPGDQNGRLTVATEQLELHANEGMYFYKDLPFTGLAQTHDAAGVLVEETTFEAGKREGYRQKWYGNGQLSYRAHYVQGRLDGTTHTWWIDGQMRSESSFTEGVSHGTQRQWYKSGALFKEINLVGGKEEGMQKAWRENGKLYNNYQARNGRIYGLKRANLCYELDDEEVQYVN